MNITQFHYTTLFLLLMLACSGYNWSQEMVYQRDIGLKAGINISANPDANDKRQVFPVVTEDNQSILFFLDRLEIRIIQLDQEFQETGEYIIARQANSFSKLLAHSYLNNNHYLYFSNNRENQFLIHTINVEGNTNSWKELDLKLKKERFLEAIPYKNKIYFLTIRKNSSLLKLYEFEGSKPTKTFDFDLSGYKFSRDGLSNLYTVLQLSIPIGEKRPLVTKINGQIPVAMETASAKSKLYIGDDYIQISIDNELVNTKLIKIDLESMKPEVNVYRQPPANCFNDRRITSNAFVLDQLLFQVKSCKSALAMRVTDLESGEFKANYLLRDTSEIEFKNGPVIQRGGTSIYTHEAYRELQKTSQFLRKISTGEVGISAYKMNDRLIVSLGGYKEVRQVAPTPSAVPGGAPGQFTVYGPGYDRNVTLMDGYNSMRYSRAVYLQSIFDSENFQHLKGDEAIETAFDKIEKFQQNMDEETLLQRSGYEVLYKLNNSFIYGYYDRLKKQYTLHQFQDFE